MSEKVRENRLRRKAARQGLALRKSRSRTPEAPDYGTYCLVDESSNCFALADRNMGYGYDLDDIEKYLNEDESDTDG